LLLILLSAVRDRGGRTTTRGLVDAKRLRASAGAGGRAVGLQLPHRTFLTAPVPGRTHTQHFACFYIP